MYQLLNKQSPSQRIAASIKPGSGSLQWMDMHEVEAERWPAAVMSGDKQLTGTGKYFEVRYFLNIIVGTSHTCVL